MATNSIPVQGRVRGWNRPAVKASSSVNSAITVAGRVLFSLIFIISSFGHFSKQTISYAASQGVPLASLAVPLSGVLALAGGLSILLGYRARLGAWLIAIFLVPVTLLIHKFWGIADPVAAQMQQIMFFKNVTMLGGALLISQFGAGPVSFDARHER
jgi:putative oxidoreductase